MPTSFWGLTYMAVLIALMAPCLFFKDKRVFAAAMIVLWFITRVTLLPGDMVLSYQATAFFYTITAFLLLHIANYSTQSALIAICLFIVSMTGISASWGWLPLDLASSIYELFGLFAMITIIGPEDYGILRRIRSYFKGSFTGAFPAGTRRDAATRIIKEKD